MGKRQLHPPVTRRFLLCIVAGGIVAGAACRLWGEEITVWLEDLPATRSGWQVLGWLFGGPPLLLAALAWNDRARFDPAQRRLRATVYGVWLGLGGFVVPALSGDSYELFGPGVEVGNPLAFGWACGAVANAVAVAFALGISTLRRRAEPAGHPAAGAAGNAIATRFVEVAWTVLVGAALLFAAYGEQLGFVF